jgi:hypothetical protein
MPRVSDLHDGGESLLDLIRREAPRCVRKDLLFDSGEDELGLGIVETIPTWPEISERLGIFHVPSARCDRPPFFPPIMLEYACCAAMQRVVFPAQMDR